MYKPQKIIFFEVKNTKEKIKKLIDLSHFHFEQNQPLLIFTENPFASNFVDELLWKEPKNSFLPHIVTQKKTNCLITITYTLQNLNNSHYLFNLSSNYFSLEWPLHLLYEYDDLITNKKKESTKKKFQFYKKTNCFMEAKN